jgi:hypothetical protein
MISDAISIFIAFFTIILMGIGFAWYKDLPRICSAMIILAFAIIILVFTMDYYGIGN